MKRFALVGAAGYIAPRHMGAIRDIGGELAAAMDINDSAGILDSYFPEARYFTEFEQFDAYMDAEMRAGRPIGYSAIASPNYLHAAHIRQALRSGADAICEKPLVLDPREIDELADMERATGRQVSTILQLRLHPAIIALREQVAAGKPDTKADIDLTYITSRGHWYLQSWKGDERKSGGLATNIGVHFYDMLHFVYGPLQDSIVHLSTPTRAAGFLEYARARVRWFLSINADDLPPAEKASGKRTFRAITANNENIEFSDGFTDLHTRSYEAILAGRGFGLEESRAAIETVARIRNAPLATHGDRHPLVAAVS